MERTSVAERAESAKADAATAPVPDGREPSGSDNQQCAVMEEALVDGASDGDCNSHSKARQVELAHLLSAQPLVLAHLVALLGSRDAYSLMLVNKAWARELSKPMVWEILAGVPYQPLLVNCFRRASSYCLREIDLPSPNVNRRGSPPVIRACLLGERTSIREYVADLRHMAMENRWFRAAPRKFGVSDVRELANDDNKNASYFDNAKILVNDIYRTKHTRVLTGGLEQDSAKFYLWSLEKQRLSASVSQNHASCFHVCNDALAVGSTDGIVNIWDFSALDSRNFDALPQVHVAPTASLSHRTSFGMVPFIRTRSKDRITRVHIDHSDGTFLHLATATEKGDAYVWDVTKGEVLLTIGASKIHKSALARSGREAHPQITSLMLLRSTLVVGTSCGFIRVFDMRSGSLTHRLGGHPDAVLKTDTRGRVLWSAGKEGSVRWWGGKTAKVLSKSALCDGGISALEMDDTMVMAGYSNQGMEAWDVRTQQSMCSFSSSHLGGIKSLQFDSKKILTVSNTGKAALWRWYAPNPVYWFDQPTPSTKFVSGQFNDRHLILGTDNGDLLDYDRMCLY